MGRMVLLVCAAVLTAAACTGPEASDEVTDVPEGDAEERSEEPADTVDDEADEPDEIEQEIAEIAEQVSVLRELPLLEEVRTEVLEPDELAEVVTERDGDTETLERTRAAEEVLVKLRHLPEGTGLEEIIDSLLTTSVVGLYDPEDGIAYISSEAQPLDPRAASTTAHELAHALQDQHFDLSRLDDIPEWDSDAALAFLSVAEGDAVIVEEEWAATYQTEEERAEAEQEQIARAETHSRALENTPSYVVESFVFPYVAGERFVTALINEGGYEAVDEALEDPPETTLEVLDPDQYMEGFEQEDVTSGIAPGDDWNELFTSTFGAFELLALFGSSLEGGAGEGAGAWPAWRGGAIDAWERDGEVALAVSWTFADTERADLVCGAVGEWYVDVAGAEAEGDGSVLRSADDVLVVDCDADDVRFALGPSEEVAAATLGD